MNILDLTRPPPAPAERSWSLVVSRPRGTDRSLRPDAMNAAELMFFFGAPFAHIVAYEEHLRLTRREQAARRLARSRPRLGFVRQLAAVGAPSSGEPGPR